ncbi:MAG: conserved rane protein of unknown function [Candidatus Saccharibacteria bacterium]|nr:conserved rane protein of unknown function [Candidatus Saccharibacteria bacterium]
MADTTSTEIKITQDDLHLAGAPSGIQQNQVESLLMTVYVIAGIVAVMAIIYGGVRYTLSGGDSGNVKSAKDTILYAIVGLVVIMMAAAITDFVIKNVAK